MHGETERYWTMERGDDEDDKDDEHHDDNENDNDLLSSLNEGAL